MRRLCVTLLTLVAATLVPRGHAEGAEGPKVLADGTREIIVRGLTAR
jgi:hypothetical protein